MAQKKKAQNKSEKASTESKKVSSNVNWDEQPMMVDIIFNGKKTNTHKSSAQLLVEKGVAKLA